MAPRHPEPSVFDSVPVLASVGAIDVEFPGEETEELFADDEPEPFVHRAESDLMPDVPDPALAAALGRLEQFLAAIQHARHA